MHHTTIKKMSNTILTTIGKMETEEFYEDIKFAHSLRIGNYYKWFHEESESYHKADIDFIKNQFEYEESDGDAEQFCRGWWAAPIHLTTEILQKAGFNKETKPSSIKGPISFDVYTLGIFTYNTSHGHFWIDGKYGFFVEPLYLHQLQNIYYSLTGKELTITI